MGLQVVMQMALCHEALRTTFMRAGEWPLRRLIQLGY